MSTHTPGPWHQHQSRPAADARTRILTESDEIVAIIESGSAPENRALMTASPRLADALWDLLVALGKHCTKFDDDALADICPACDKASSALIASGRVMG